MHLAKKLELIHTLFRLDKSISYKIEIVKENWLTCLPCGSTRRTVGDLSHILS